MLKINNNPSYESQASNLDFPFFRALEYSAKNPNPITSQNVNIVTIIVGVFMYFASLYPFNIYGNTMELNDIQEICGFYDLLFGKKQDRCTRFQLNNSSTDECLFFLSLA